MRLLDEYDLLPMIEKTLSVEASDPEGEELRQPPKHFPRSTRIAMARIGVAPYRDGLTSNLLVCPDALRRPLRRDFLHVLNHLRGIGKEHPSAIAAEVLQW